MRKPAFSICENNDSDQLCGNCEADQRLLGCEPDNRVLPTPREFCRHILSERTTQAASNKRRLHLVSGGISL